MLFCKHKRYGGGSKMVESIANKITSFLISNKAIEEKESELYSYAFSIVIIFLKYYKWGNKIL